MMPFPAPNRLHVWWVWTYPAYSKLRIDGVTSVQPMVHREYGLLAPGMPERVRGTSEPFFYEEHAESVEQSSPGNLPLAPPEFLAPGDDSGDGRTLQEILDG